MVHGKDEGMQFEKTKPIFGTAKLAQTLTWKEYITIFCPAGRKKTKPFWRLFIF